MLSANGHALHEETPMRDTDLFQLALGLVPPWLVKEARFDVDKKRLDLEIDFSRGGLFPCSGCNKPTARRMTP